jgi:hypothetical protein
MTSSDPTLLLIPPGFSRHHDRDCVAGLDRLNSACYRYDMIEVRSFEALAGGFARLEIGCRLSVGQGLHVRDDASAKLAKVFLGEIGPLQNLDWLAAESQLNDLILLS